MINDVYNQHCTKGMSLMSENSVDMIITDPPFAIDFKKEKSNYNRDQTKVLDGYQDVSEQRYGLWTFQWMYHAYRVLKEDGSMYVFSGWNNLHHILRGLQDNNFHTINHIIWKYNFGVHTKNKYVTSHYHLLYVCKDPKKRKFKQFGVYDNTKDSYRDREDVWHINREYWTGKVKTPTKLPADIIRKILMYSSEPRDVVLDPFLGSGQVCWIAKDMDRQYIGFEISQEIFEFAKQRIDTGEYLICPKNQKKKKSKTESKGI